MRRVVLIGPESTGKTTLAMELAAHYRTEWVPEFARAYLDAKPASLEFADVVPIAHGQMAAEEAGARAASGVLILDTDLTSTTVYSQHYYGSCPAWIEHAARARTADLYLLTDVDVPWIPDPQRDRPHHREEMLALFRDALVQRGITPVVLQGSWAARRQRAIEAIDAVIRGS